MNPSRIMIVEDNTTVAEDCRDCLEARGYNVTSIVASGEESIERAEVERPDSVIIDIHLRDKMDGIEAAEQIHSRFEIPVIFLSAYNDHDLLERAKLTGAFGYLIKPFEENELYATLEIVLYKAKAEKKRRQMEVRLHQAQQLETIGVFAGGIAHQFNNDLSTITGYTDLLEMDFSGDAKVINYTKAMKASACRMAQLTAQLLAYARGGQYHVQTVSSGDFIRNTLPLIRYTINPAIHVETDLPNDLFNVKADLTQMQMMLSAVLINASEAMEGKGCIRVACRNIMITDETVKDFPELKPGNYVNLTIIDDGRGMDKETKKRIFEPFFTTNFQGRGLGMAAVYGIVKNHAGWISIDSEPGQGTIVRIYLPAAQA